MDNALAFIDLVGVEEVAVVDVEIDLVDLVDLVVAASVIVVSVVVVVFLFLFLLLFLLLLFDVFFSATYM